MRGPCITKSPIGPSTLSLGVGSISSGAVGSRDDARAKEFRLHDGQSLSTFTGAAIERAGWRVTVMPPMEITDRGPVHESFQGFRYVTEQEQASFEAAFAPRSVEHRDPELLWDERKIAMASLVQRLGQLDFRRKLIDVYGGRCAITRCDVSETLQAAHIVPYLGAQSNATDNGLLLRADIHNLFDSHLLSIDPETLTVCLAAKLLGSSYAMLQGVHITCPVAAVARPNPEGLRLRHENFRRNGQ